MMVTEASTEVLRVAEVSKAFPGVQALQAVSLGVAAGEVHALVGENGAGKTTLVAIAAGELAPDAGSVEIGGEPLEASTPRAAQRLGLAQVHQHPALAPDLTVAENLYLGLPAERRPKLGKVNSWAAGILERGGIDVSPTTEAADLSTGEWHLIEMAKALALEPRVLILDEPTEFLDREQVDRLFAQIRDLVAHGTGVVYISHRIREVQQIADRVTVLRDGEVVGSFVAGEVDEDGIVAMIVGRPVDTVFPPKARDADSPPTLRLRGVSGEGFRDVDLEVQPGQIVGLGGIEGNGQREFLRALAGLGGVDGEVRLDGESVRLGSPERARAAGLVHIPGERHREGLFLSLPVRHNVSAMSLPRYAVGGLLRIRREAAGAANAADSLQIRTPSVETGVAALSGGNQQKAMMARATLAEPRVLLVDEPTQGVDAGGRVEIFRILRNVADEGAPVVVVAADARELAGLCDRVVIFSRGRTVGELSGDDVTEENITGAALRSTTLRDRGSERAHHDRPPLARRLLARDTLPSVVLALLIVALGMWATQVNGSYLTGQNLGDVMALASVIAFVALGQLILVLVGSLDLSVGPLIGLLVCLGSFFFTDGGAVDRILLGIFVLALVCIGAGVLNGTLAEGLHINPVVATLATFFVFQGISLELRPTPEGLASQDVTGAIDSSFGFVPVAFVLVIVLGLLLQRSLRHTRWGLSLRGVGSDPNASRRLGLPVRRVRFFAYVACSFSCLAAGLLSIAQLGVGDATAGTSYTLSSLTAVLLGGARVQGGRGSFVGVVLGAILIQQTATVAQFLNLSAAWTYWLVGGLALGAVVVYSRGWRRNAQPAATVDA
jgi:ribose transport system ATP-binding protein